MRQTLRQIQDHLGRVHESLGAVRESVGMVTVYHHPTNVLPHLNYVTPRQNTAWVSEAMIQQGLQYLGNLGRAPRVQYIEGLYPPQLAAALRKLDLEVEREIPIMIYKVGGIGGRVPPPIQPGMLPDGIAIESVQDHRGMEAWWYVYRNAYYDVLTLGVEPLLVGRDMAALRTGDQVDYILYRYGFPAGVARVSLYGETAHILCIALLREIRTPAMLQLIMRAAARGALERGARIVFLPGETEGERRMGRELGFLDFGSVVCYAANSTALEGLYVSDLDLSVLMF
jgi:hypothetical protein